MRRRAGGGESNRFARGGRERESFFVIIAKRPFWGGWPSRSHGCEHMSRGGRASQGAQPFPPERRLSLRLPPSERGRAHRPRRGCERLRARQGSGKAEVSLRVCVFLFLFFPLIM